MTEQTIVCPDCKFEFKLTESLAAPLNEAVRKQYEQQPTQQDRDITTREQAMREKEEQLAEATSTLDEQVTNQVEEQLKRDRATICADEARKAKQAAATDLEQKARELTELQGVLKQRDEKLAEAQNAVAHKMGRRWIMVELGEHCHTHIIPRLKKVIDGEDKGGIPTPWGGKAAAAFATTA